VFGRSEVKVFRVAKNSEDEREKGRIITFSSYKKIEQTVYIYIYIHKIVAGFLRGP
jgi:hypothetical protein